jgi:aminoglycoside phosphotransferase (APT) family kinase protein
MRFRFKPTATQRTDLRARRAELERPARLIELLRDSLPAGFDPGDATSTVVSEHADRFVVRARVRSTGGEERTYALKAYSDEFGSRVWAHACALAPHVEPDRDGPALPMRYIPDERLLVFPWIEGAFLSEVSDERQPELLRRAARLAANLHRLPLVPEEPTGVDVVVADTRGRCDRLRRRWPATAACVEPLMAIVEEAATCLDPTGSALVHGDMASGQFLWTGERLVLLDLDMFGYTDPAYDVGHFLAQLERRCLRDRVEPTVTRVWLDAFRDAYLEAMPPPRVSPRNVWFYHGITLVRKIYTLYRKQPSGWQRLVVHLVAQARMALEEAMPAAMQRR